MKANGIFAQIAIIIVAVAIVVSYVHPTMQSISETQEDTITYELERQKVNAVNAQLAELMSKMDSVSAADQRKLDMYLPEQLDDVNVVRDLYLMAQEAQVWFRMRLFLVRCEREVVHQICLTMMSIQSRFHLP
jgi:uncharacterized lipoprotein